MTRGNVLTAWVAANPHAPARWRVVAERVAGVVHDMPTFNAILLAWDAVRQEEGRLSQAAEAAALALVGKKIHELREAIERAPLPRTKATALTLAGSGAYADVPVWVSWHEVPDTVTRGMHAITVQGMLDAAEELLRKHEAALPPRAVRRRRDRPVPSAFVHWLDFYARQEGIEIDAELVAEITNAALALSDTLIADDVRAILKTTPTKLKNVKRRR